MSDKIYMTKDNIWAVASATEFTVEELIELMAEEPEAKWVIKISGIQKEVGHGPLTDLQEIHRNYLRDES